MSFAVSAAFGRAIATAGADDAVQVVIITGAGGAFCAGTDLSDLPDLKSAPKGAPSKSSGPREPWPIVRCPKPVVAAVDGPAVGMGAEIATQCDVRIASTTARFAWNFVRRGLVADTGAGSFLLPRIIGHTESLRLLYSGEFIDADTALRLGFVSAVVPPEQLLAASREEAVRFLAGSPFAIARTKEFVYAALDGDTRAHLARTDELLRECMRSKDHREGVAAFMERREPNFTGR
jgi:enoyl-CoA hydratase/carnithine racemase